MSQGLVDPLDVVLILKLRGCCIIYTLGSPRKIVGAFEVCPSLRRNINYLPKVVICKYTEYRLVLICIVRRLF